MVEQTLPRSTKLAMAVACAVSVANLYYLQPLLNQLAREFHVPQGQAGIAATLSQIGYATGMLTVVPLGDSVERRKLILSSLAVTFLALLWMATASSFPLLCAAAFAVGLATCTPQLIVPFAAHLAAPAERGRVVGYVMSGLLIGILLARTVSGFIGELSGWRTVYWTAIVADLALIGMLAFTLPTSEPTQDRLPYPKLMQSLLGLLRDEPVLRESAIYGAALFGAFSAFWTTLAFRLADAPFHLGPKAVGLFGLVGAAGALAAPIAGKRADGASPQKTIAFGIILTGLSFVIYLIPTIWALVVGVVWMDIGVQASHISNQSRIFARRPDARSRMNTVYMTSYFVGGASGAAAAAWAWSRAGWLGVCGVGIGCSAIAFLNFVMALRNGR